jgi:hypothetical protein
VRTAPRGLFKQSISGPIGFTQETEGVKRIYCLFCAEMSELLEDIGPAEANVSRESDRFARKLEYRR